MSILYPVLLETASTQKQTLMEKRAKKMVTTLWIVSNDTKIMGGLEVEIHIRPRA
jgi:hypothetical protein